MLQYILWAISFFTLWVTIIWLAYLYSPEKRKKELLRSITIAIPAYNEAKTLAKTVDSIVNANFPKKLLHIFIINDGSKDNTKEVALSLIKKYKSFKITLINKRNGGKASAINLALKKAKTDFFSVLDADSRIDKKSIKILMSNFEDPNVGAAISRIKVDVPKKLIERIQRFEYIMSTLLRKVMSALGTLAMTPGVLSMYNTKILKKIGGFVKDDNNLTEDLEVALRLRKNGYSIALEHKSITYTCAPNTIKELWNQRIRWSRGYIYNHWNYRKMFFSKEHGLFGVFQLPINLVAILFLVINILIISIMFIRETTELVIRSLTIEGYFMNYITDIPTLKDYFLSLNIHIILPLIVAAFLGFYMIYSAHRQFKERVRKNVIPMVAYFLFIPYFLTVNWVISLIKEIFRFKRSW